MDEYEIIVGATLPDITLIIAADDEDEAISLAIAQAGGDDGFNLAEIEMNVRSLRKL